VMDHNSNTRKITIRMAYWVSAHTALIAE